MVRLCRKVVASPAFERVIIFAVIVASPISAAGDRTRERARS
jgi:hypothetical protein